MNTRPPPTPPRPGLVRTPTRSFGWLDDRLDAEVQRLSLRRLTDLAPELLVDRDAARPAGERAVATDEITGVERAPGELRHSLLVRLAGRLVHCHQVEPDEEVDLALQW